MGRAIIWMVMLFIVTGSISMVIIAVIASVSRQKRQREQWERQEIARLEAERRAHDERG